MRFAIDIHLGWGEELTTRPKVPLPDPIPADRVIWTVHAAYFPDADRTSVAEWGLAHARERFGSLALEATFRVERTPGLD